MNFLHLQQAGSAGSFCLNIKQHLCVGPRDNAFMFGGIGLAAAVSAAEQATGRATVWASAQFISYARLNDDVCFEVQPSNTGRHVSQATIIGRVGSKAILSVNAALGYREGFPEDQWATAPDMPPLEECVPSELWPPQDGAARLIDHLDMRVAAGRGAAWPHAGRRSEDGRQVMWLRLKNDEPVNSAALAIFADFVPSGVAAAFGRPGGGNSLDNTLRIHRIVPTRWVLCEVRISGAARGFGHGAIYIFAEDGTLLASGSQSLILRFLSNPPDLAAAK